MPKKSHRVASRQAAASKERKRKKRSQSFQRGPTTSEVKPAAEPSAVSEPAIQPSATPQPAAKLSATPASPQYRYFIADLRKIAVIAGAMLTTLIVLAFVLG